MFCPQCGNQNKPQAKFCIKCGSKLEDGQVQEEPQAPGKPPKSSHLNPDVILDKRYKIIGIIEKGGMGAVYKAMDLRLDIICAVKEMRENFEREEYRIYAIEKFKSEALILSKLRHPNIPRVSDYFIENNHYYIVMDYIEGQTLFKILNMRPSRRLDEDELITHALQLSDVLSYLHHQDPPIIYRDIKPANIMITKDDRLYLIDFGIARIFNPKARGTMIGTQGYSPPEQYRGKVEPRSDIYALGATLHHLLTGKDPQLDAPFSFQPVKKLRYDVSDRFAMIIDKCLKFNIEDRFETVDKLREFIKEKTPMSALSKLAPVNIQPQPSNNQIPTDEIKNKQAPAAPAPSAPSTEEKSSDSLGAEPSILRKKPQDKKSDTEIKKLLFAKEKEKEVIDDLLQIIAEQEQLINLDERQREKDSKKEITENVQSIVKPVAIPDFIEPSPEIASLQKEKNSPSGEIGNEQATSRKKPSGQLNDSLSISSPATESKEKIGSDQKKSSADTGKMITDKKLETESALKEQYSEVMDMADPLAIPQKAPSTADINKDPKYRAAEKTNELGSTGPILEPAVIEAAQVEEKEQESKPKKPAPQKSGKSDYSIFIDPEEAGKASLLLEELLPPEEKNRALGKDEEFSTDFLTRDSRITKAVTLKSDFFGPVAGQTVVPKGVVQKPTMPFGPIEIKSQVNIVPDRKKDKKPDNIIIKEEPPAAQEDIIDPEDEIINYDKYSAAAKKSIFESGITPPVRPKESPLDIDDEKPDKPSPKSQDLRDVVPVVVSSLTSKQAQFMLESENSPWFTFRGNEAHSGCNQKAKECRGNLKWRFRSNGRIYSSPTIDLDGTVYFGSNDGCLYALSTSEGKEKWRFITDNPVSTAPLVVKNRGVFFGSEDGNFYAVNFDGKEIWRKHMSSSVFSAATAGKDGTVFVGSNDGNLYAISPEGTEKWRYAVNNFIYSSPAISQDNVVYIGAWDKCLHAVSSANGKQLWKFKADDIIDSSPAIDISGNIYFGCYDNCIYSLDKSGKLRWKYRTRDKIFSSPSIDINRGIYIGGHDNFLYNLSFDGKVRWRYRTSYWIKSSPAVDRFGNCYIGSDDFIIYGINPDGETLWKFKTNGSVESSPCLTDSGVLFIGSNDGWLYALE